MFEIIFVIIGSLVGAGFASGREIYIFFMKYGKNGTFGILLTGIIISLIVYKTLCITKTFEIDSYNRLLERVNWKHEKLNKITNFIVNVFLLSSFYIMVAGFGSYINQTYNIPIYISSILFVAVCYVVFKKNISGVVKVNKFLVPLLIFLIAFIGIINITNLSSKNDIQNIFVKTNENIILERNIFGKVADNWLVSSILYASYNSIIIIPILTTISKLVKNKKQIIKVSIISGLVVIFLAICILITLPKDAYFIAQYEMPLLPVVEKIGVGFKYIYGFIIIASIFTSAVSTGYGFLRNMKNYNYDFILIVMCVSSIFVSNIGFSNLVGTLYPLFGVFGLLQIFQIS